MFAASPSHASYRNFPMLHCPPDFNAIVFRLRVAMLLGISMAVAFASTATPNLAVAADRYVHPDGDDDNPGTRKLPWRTITESALRLAPGDVLRIARKTFPAEGTPKADGTRGPILLRFVDVENNYAYIPLEGSPTQRTRLVPYGPGKRMPRIMGSLDIRGAYIQVSGLQFVGDGVSTAPGIAAYESHHITVSFCKVRRFGGGGINFNQCDVVRATNNVCTYNATTNPDQHSGISSYQPIVRSDTDEVYGVVFSGNICYRNENLVGPFEGADVTDGNGIAIDDHRYTQLNDLIASATMNLGEPGLSSGSPIIEMDEQGALQPYQRRSAVRNNFLVSNGGRGLAVVFSNQIEVAGNILGNNLLSPAFTEGLPTDESDNPFFLQGELTLVDSFDCLLERNLAVARNDQKAAVAELFFDFTPENLISPNSYFSNRFVNVADPSRSVSVFGVEESPLDPSGNGTGK